MVIGIGLLIGACAVLSWYAYKFYRQRQDLLSDLRRARRQLRHVYKDPGFYSRQGTLADADSTLWLAISYVSLDSADPGSLLNTPMGTPEHPGV